MQKRGVILALVFVLLYCLSGFGAEGKHGMVVSVSPEATEAGLAVLRTGGNAVDAAVATALTLGVVDANNSGLGGGCFMLIRTATGKVIAIDGREKAPAAATRDMFVRDGKARLELSQAGALAIGVPGSLAAYDYAVHRYGRKKLSELIGPAAELAERGFVVTKSYSRLVQSVSNDLVRFSASSEIFLPEGKPLRAGQVLRQPDLAASYRAIARKGTSWFYRGPFAVATESWMRQNRGLITRRDFRDYRIVLRKPVVTSYRDFQVIGFPPPSSGGLNVAEILNIVERFELRGLEPAERYHVMAEAMKLAFADRAFWLGDPDFVRVPTGLIHKDYAANLAARIRPGQAVPVQSHGNPPGAEAALSKKHTTHFSTADADGNWVACTATLNTTFGSKVVIPGTGIMMNNQMDDFSIQPGVSNYFGLVGAEANAVAAGKRPLSSMSPTIVLRNGKPCAALGAAGGPTIISQVVQQLIGMLDLDLTPAQALREPRIHHQWSPDQLVVEKALAGPMKDALTQRGHSVREVESLGACQVIRARDDGTFVGEVDPRGSGEAAGF